MFIETSPSPIRGCGLSGPPPITTASVDVRGSGYPKFRNDHGVPEICIGVREFKCIGVSPPQDHPHIYIDMGEAGHDPLSLLRDAVPLRSPSDTA